MNGLDVGAHTRSGHRIAITAHLCSGDNFDRAMTDFAALYADQNQRDFETAKWTLNKGPNDN